MSIRIEMPRAFDVLLLPSRYYVFYGGRGRAASWSVGRRLLGRTYREPIRVGCFREYQTSIKDSVHKLLKDQIALLGLSHAFEVTDKSIRSWVGGEFLFKGMFHNEIEIKSTEGLDVAWVEEAQATSKASFEALRPTIRKPGSQLIFTMNTGAEKDAAYQELIKNAGQYEPDHPERSWIVRKLTYLDNPWFSPELEAERQHMFRICQASGDMSAYNNVWMGDPLAISNAVIFRGKCVVEAFDSPEGGPNDPRFYYGVDWGFSGHPMCLLRQFMTRNPDGTYDLWIDYAQFGYGVEYYDFKAFFTGGKSTDGTREWEGVPGAGRWPIKADNESPSNISFCRSLGLNVTPAEKWPGSVEDGIRTLKGFRVIHIHQRNKQMAQEADLYSYKVDKNTGEVLPIIVDAHNHGWDASRYSLDGYVQRKGLPIISDAVLAKSRMSRR